MSNFTRVDWDNIINTGSKAYVKLFAIGEVSGRDFYRGFAGDRASGQVRSLLRNHGVVYARRLARKALRRRGVKVSV